MNYYERIQKSIDYIERNLEDKISINVVAQEAYMALSSYYRMFFAIVGYSVKEYIRLRRISHAAEDILNSNMHIIDIAVKYDYTSSDSFSRAFQRITGFLPSKFKNENKTYQFERMNIMEKHFEIQDKELLEKYPDIKVLKKIEPIRVAYYCYYGKDPETNAFSVIIDWLNKNDINVTKEYVRIFGYNNPSPSSDEQEEYGYEICVTIDNHIDVNDEKVKTKTLEGGLYAVTGIKRDDSGDVGYEIMRAWKRFQKWLKDSKYKYGGHQWLEEHLGFDENCNHIGNVDLYMPIAEKMNLATTKHFEHVEPMWTAIYTAKGKNAADKARNYFFKWANDEGLFENNLNSRFFAYYNHERMGCDDFFYKIHVTVNKKFKTDDTNIKLEEFKGGHYAVMKSKFKINGWIWGEFIDWISQNEKYDIGDYWFFEEYKLDKPKLEMETDMVLHMPIKKKD